MTSPVYNLWSHVLYCSTEGISPFIMVNSFLTQAKVWIVRQRQKGIIVKRQIETEKQRITVFSQMY